MDLRSTIKQLDESIAGYQRENLREKLGDDSWEAYEAVMDPDEDDEDEIAVALVRFVASLADPDDFKASLTDDQRELVDQLEEHLRAEMGL